MEEEAFWQAGHQLGRNQLQSAMEEEAEKVVWLEADASVEEEPKEEPGRPKVDAAAEEEPKEEPGQPEVGAAV